MALGFLDLPDELILSVLSHFLIDDLQNVSLACRRLNVVAHSLVQHHVNLKRMYHRINDPFQNSPSGWLQPLVGLLKDEFPASYVEQLLIAQCEWYYADLPAYDDFERSQLERRPNPFTEDDMKLVAAATAASPWITSHDACGRMANAKTSDEFLKEVREGDQDNILAVLVPLLPNLSRLYLPKEIDSDGIPMGSLIGVVGRIACAYAARGSDSVADLPLQHLEHIECTRVGVYPYVGRDLMQISSFAALPSVKTMKLGETWQNSFTWPRALPKSRLQYVEFVGGNVELDAIRGFARGIAGPCTFKHRRRSRFGPNSTSESRWTLAKSDDLGIIHVLKKEGHHWLFSRDTDSQLDNLEP